MYRIENYKEKEDKKPDVLSRIEKEVSFTRREVEQILLEKSYTGECVITYNGTERKGIVLSLSTNGNMKIGILKE
jgi:hypothetical protein